MKKASKYGILDVVKALIQAGANVNLQDNWGYSPLWWGI